MAKDRTHHGIATVLLIWYTGHRTEAELVLLSVRASQVPVTLAALRFAHPEGYQVATADRVRWADPEHGYAAEEYFRLLHGRLFDTGYNMVAAQRNQQRLQQEPAEVRNVLLGRTPEGEEAQAPIRRPRREVAAVGAA